jgi:hypothetical protein
MNTHSVIGSSLDKKKRKTESGIQTARQVVTILPQTQKSSKY